MYTALLLCAYTLYSTRPWPYSTVLDHGTRPYMDRAWLCFDLRQSTYAPAPQMTQRESAHRLYSALFYCSARESTMCHAYAHTHTLHASYISSLVLLSSTHSLIHDIPASIQYTRIMIIILLHSFVQSVATQQHTRTHTSSIYSYIPHHHTLTTVMHIHSHTPVLSSPRERSAHLTPPHSIPSTFVLPRAARPEKVGSLEPHTTKRLGQNFGFFGSGPLTTKQT